MFFLALGADVIERIAFWCASIFYLLPPSDIIALASTCRILHDIVLGSPDRPNYTLFSQIADFRYSTSAPRRRLGAIINPRSLAFELTVRVSTLRRVRHGCTSNLLLDLSVLHTMCIEDDGANMQHLDFARANLWLHNIIVQDDQDLEIIRRAVAVYSLLGAVTPLPATIDLDILSKQLQYYAFSSLYHQLTYRVDELLFYYWGNFIKMSLPPLTICAAACLGVDIHGKEVLDDRVIPLRSERFDSEYYRLIMTPIAFTLLHSWSLNQVCWFGVDRLWTPGKLSGAWVGECNTSDYDWYIERFRKNWRVLIDLGFGRPIEMDGAMKPVKFNLCEHVRTGTSTPTWAPIRADGTLPDTWFSHLAEEATRTHIDKEKYTLRIGHAIDRGPYLVYNTVSHKDDPFAPDHKYQCHDYGVAIEMPCPGELPVIAASQVAPAPSLSNPSVPWAPGPTMELLPVASQGPESLQVDVVLTGQIEIGDETHEIFGRILHTNGLVTLVTCSNTLPQGPIEVDIPPNSPHWVFYGYLIGGTGLVGRWIEDPVLSLTMYEGTFVLKRGLS